MEKNNAEIKGDCQVRKTKKIEQKNKEHNAQLKKLLIQ
jgi:hypothetical protein